LFNVLLSLAKQQLRPLNLSSHNYSQAGKSLTCAYLMGKLTTIKKLFKCFIYIAYQIRHYTLRFYLVVAFLSTAFSHHHPF
jgi:hypothetical protein